MPILVRPVEPQDIPAFSRLLRAKAKFDGVAHLLQATEQNLRDELFSARPTARAIVAVVDEALVGMATYFQTYSSFLMKPGLWLDDLYVDELHRKSGVGRELLEWLCRAAASNGCARIEWIVAVDNDNGRGFYERVGVEIFETLRLARLHEAAIRAHAGAACLTT